MRTSGHHIISSNIYLSKRNGVVAPLFELFYDPPANAIID